MLEVINLNKTYRNDSIETHALNNLNIKIENGEFVAIMGASGSGKTTLLNILGLLDKPTSGQYIIMGNDVGRYSDKQRTSLRKQEIGFVFQSFNLIDELNVFENIELPLLYKGLSPKDRKERVNSVMTKLGIAQREKHFPQQLSGGQQQRVAIARAVVSSPKLILADEPTGNLDSVYSNEILNLLTDLNETGVTVIMVTHSSYDSSFANRVIHLHDGEIISETRQPKHEVLL